MTGWLSTTPTPPRTHEIPAAVATRINTSRMADLLWADDRVFTETDEPVDREEDPSLAGGRVVVMLARPLFPGAQEPAHRSKHVPVLVKAEVNDPGDGFNHRQALEAVLEEVFNRLEGWKPSMAKASVSFPMYRRGRVTTDPLWDDEKGVWAMTDEYRLLVGPA